MNKNRISSERVVAVVGLVFLLVASIVSIIMNGDPNSIIEKVAPTHVVIPVVHIVCVILALVFLITQSLYVMISIFIIESELTILTNFEELGIFFFYAAIILILCKDLIKNKPRKKIFILFVIHLITLLLNFFRGVNYMLIDMAYSVFCFAFYLWIYYSLKAKLSCFFPKNVRDNTTIIRKPIGSTISLSDYNLNERQISFVLENLHNKMSYKEISEKYYVSISTVKKIFAEVFKIFNVSNIEELRILLLQYQVKE
jgi:DNA-binding CsgD family transcriptional regulator